MRLSRVLGVSICGSLLSAIACAADVPGSHDLEGVPRLADAEIVDYRPVTELERIYPLGSIRKISGQLRFDGQIGARGNVTSVTYQLPAEHTSDEAFTAAREALQKQGRLIELCWLTPTCTIGSLLPGNVSVTAFG